MRKAVVFLGGLGLGLVCPGPRGAGESVLSQWRRGLVDPPWWRSAHAPRGRR